MFSRPDGDSVCGYGYVGSLKQEKCICKYVCEELESHWLAILKKCVGNNINVFRRKGYTSAISVCILKCMFERKMIDPSNEIYVLC